jgi:hypothetical protein
MLSTTGAFIAAVVAAPALCQQVDPIGDPRQWSATRKDRNAAWQSA